MTKVQLSTPIEAHGEKVGELTFRPLTGADISSLGYPFLVQDGVGGTSVQPNAAVISGYIASLAGIPPSAVKTMTAADWTRCMGAVLSFFGELGPTSLTASMTSPGPGASPREKPSA